MWDILLFDSNEPSTGERMTMEESLLVKRKPEEIFLLILNYALGNPAQHTHISYSG